LAGGFETFLSFAVAAGAKKRGALAKNRAEGVLFRRGTRGLGESVSWGGIRPGSDERKDKRATNHDLG
jgi:hypothetical protein